MAAQSLEFTMIAADHAERLVTVQATGAAVAQGGSEEYTITFPSEGPTSFLIPNLTIRETIGPATPVPLVPGDIATIEIIRDEKLIWNNPVRVGDMWGAPGWISFIHPVSIPIRIFPTDGLRIRVPPVDADATPTAIHRINATLFVIEH